MRRGASHLETHQIVEPGQSDKAAFDSQEYHRAMRGGRSEVAGLVFYGFVFLAVFLSVGFAARLLDVNGGPAGTIFGITAVIATFMIKRSYQRINKSRAIKLQAQAHELEQQAKALEIEHAKANGAFEKWDQS